MVNNELVCLESIAGFSMDDPTGALFKALPFADELFIVEQGFFDRRYKEV